MASPKIQDDLTALRQAVETDQRDPTVQVVDTNVSSVSFTSAPITGGMHPADAAGLHAVTDVTGQNSLVGLLRAHLRAHYGQLLDKVFSVSDNRLFISDRLLGPMLDLTGQFQEGHRDRVGKECGLDTLLHEACDEAMKIASEKYTGKAFVDTIARIRGNFRPQVEASLRVLHEDFEKLEATRLIAPQHRWRLFIDPDRLDRLQAAGIDTSNNELLAFLFDAESPDYFYHLAKGFISTLEDIASPIDLTRYRQMAKDCCQVDDVCPNTVTYGAYWSPAGRKWLADLIDQMRDPFQISVTVMNFQGEYVRLPHAGSDVPGEIRIHGTVGGVDQQAKTGDLIETLARHGPGTRVLLNTARTATQEQLNNIVNSILSDYHDRTEAALSAQNRETPESSNDARTPVEEDRSPSEESTPDRNGVSLVEAGAYLLLSLSGVHALPNGNFRAASTLLNLHLTKFGLPLTVIHDPMTFGGSSPDEVCKMIEDGQARVRSWRRTDGDMNLDT